MEPAMIRLLLFTIMFVIFDVQANNKICSTTPSIGKNYFVAPYGVDRINGGSSIQPWKTINYGLALIPNGNTLIVREGIYTENIRINKNFSKGLLLKSEVPYLAKLTSDQRVIALVKEAENITIEGFEITHNTLSAKPLVVHIDGWGQNSVKNIVLRNNIIHDSYNNDLLKINNGAEHITVECNIFYNQGDSDEHIDVNSAANINISDNIFFNHFSKSSRQTTKKSSSFIVIKDSNSDEDRFLGAENIRVYRNVFLNWQGSHGQGFISVGEDGKPYYEAHNINIYNNLMLGNSPISMRAPLIVKGAESIKFFNNTISGDLPSNAYAVRITQEGKNKKPKNIKLYNNIWSDPTGTMGQGASESSNDFSDTLFYQVDSYTLANNLYWNGAQPLPYSMLDKINPTSDGTKLVLNSHLNSNKIINTPSWNITKKKFDDGSLDIRAAFIQLVNLNGIPKFETHQHIINDSPADDILGQQRNSPHTIGAYHLKLNTHK